MTHFRSFTRIQETMKYVYIYTSRSRTSDKKTTKDIFAK